MIPIDTKAGWLDLSWRMFGTPVRVKVSFWIVMALFGLPIMLDGEWDFSVLLRNFTDFDRVCHLLIWIACGFVGVMAHELGHIIAGRIFGFPGMIILYALGGGAVGEYQRAQRWQRIIIAAAGPAAGFTLYALCRFSLHYVDSYLHPRIPFTAQVYVNAALGDLIFMCLFWNLFNLLPVIPMDGGMIMKDVVTGVWSGGGMRFAYFVSFACAAATCGYFVYEYMYATNYVGRWVQGLVPPHMRTQPMQLGSIYMIVIYAMFAFQSFQMMMASYEPPSDPQENTAP